MYLSFLDIFSLIREWIVGRTLLLAILIVASLLAGFLASSAKDRFSRKLYLILSYCGLVSLVLLWMSLFPGFFVFGVRPPDRSIFTGIYVFIFGIILVFANIGSFLRQFSGQLSRRIISVFLYALLLILALVSPLRTTVSLIKLIPTFKLYAQVWDQRDQFLREASAKGLKDVVILSFKDDPVFRDIRKTIWIRGDMEPDPLHWINQAASVYYGLNSIVANTK